MSELYLPPTYAKIKTGCEFYQATETFRRRSEASKKKALEYWSDGRHRRRVDKKQAKPVDVYTNEGWYVSTYPSARKAAIGLFKDIDYHSAERCIRSCRQGNKKQYHGFQFRDSIDNRPAYIGPVPPKKTKASGYHVDRKPGTYATKRCRVVYPDGDAVEFASLKELCKAIGITYGAVWLSMKENRKIRKNLTIEKI